MQRRVGGDHCVEALGALFGLIDPIAAYEGWERWFDAVEASGIPALVRFAELKDYAWMVSLSMPFSISTGKLDGFNNRIRVAKRIGDGDNACYFSLICDLALPSLRSPVPKFP